MLAGYMISSPSCDFVYLVLRRCAQSPVLNVRKERFVFQSAVWLLALFEKTFEVGTGQAKVDGNNRVKL